jgi:hypothetical protein
MTPELLLVLAFLSLLASGTFAYLAYRVWRKKGADDEGEGPAREGESEPRAEDARFALPEAEAEAATVVAPVERERPSAPAPAPLPAAPVAFRPPSDHERAIPVATLLRDELTGSLIIRVGDREYRSAAELLASNDRQRIEYTAADLNRWLGIDRSPSPRPAPGETPAKRAAPRRPASMVEQINAILEKRLLERPELSRGIRLAEGPGGAIKVYVGIDSYNGIDDVPGADIRQLIREAVAEWEAGA